MCDVLTVYGDLNDIALSSSYWLNNLDAAACRAEKTWGPAGSRLLAGLLPESDKVLGKHFMDESLQVSPSLCASLNCFSYERFMMKMRDSEMF
jgi:hypothetical protein